MPGYAASLAGWWQAITVGLAGYQPTWHFLRNGMAGDLCFVLLLFLDRVVSFRPGPGPGEDGLPLRREAQRFTTPPAVLRLIGYAAAGSLSTCWNSYRHQDGYEMLKEIRKLGFPAAELGHGIRMSLWPGVLKAWEEDVIKIRSLHNFCPVPTSVFRPNPNCYEYSDARPEMRAFARKASEETIRQAAKLGAKAVVFHLGSAGPYGITRKLETLYKKGEFLNRRYTDLKVKAVQQRKKSFETIWPRVKESLDPLVALAGELKIRLGFEIREDFEEFPHEEEFPGVLDSYPADVVGYWHDFGHAARKEFMGWHDHAETLRLRSPRLFGCHIHDCRRPQDDHLPLGHGEIEFAKLLPHVPENAIAVLELSPGTPEEQVIASRHLWNSYAAASV